MLSFLKKRLQGKNYFTIFALELLFREDLHKNY